MSIPDAPSRPHVAHLTSVHSRTDSRVYTKQCRSLAREGFRVTLVVADGMGDATPEDGLHIIDVGLPSNRLDRVLFTTRLVFERAVDLDADLYQFHDPELLAVGLKLKKLGKRVIFDSHEDVPKQLLGKAYLPRWVLRLMAGVFAPFEGWAVGRLDAVIGATPTITEKFRPRARRAANVNNYPILNELWAGTTESTKRAQVCYVGGISKERGIVQMVEALARTRTGARLELAGNFPDRALRASLVDRPGWSLIDERGFCDRTQVKDILARSIGGMVVLEPVPNHIESLPVKMFEYMAAGIPVIASDFALWRDIIDSAGCGICVDPGDADAIAGAIDRLVGDPEDARRMGENGRRAVTERFNWAQEEEALLQLYRSVLAAA